MNLSVSLGVVLIFWANAKDYDVETYQRLDFSKNVSIPLKRFWTSTGFSPTPIQNFSNFLLSKDEELNLALIGAVPNEGIKHVRIHWLLDLITINCTNEDSWTYDYENLFNFISRLEINRLSPGFELMGNLSGCFQNWTQLSAIWPVFLENLLKNFINRFNLRYVKTWRFETFNEPDLRMYNVWNLTSSDFISFITLTSDTLSKFNLTLWGPAGLFKNKSHHPLCWGILDYCQTNKCPLDVLTFHKKGDGIASQVVQRGTDLVREIHSKYPELNLSFVNDESDPMTGWMKPMAWRADVRYAGAVAQIIIGHWHHFKELKADLEGISNDNGFLGFSPYYWTQRTLVARFQMNDTIPPHVQLFKKPVLLLMEMVSLLGEKVIDFNYSFGNPGISYIVTEENERRAALITINNDMLPNVAWKNLKKSIIIRMIFSPVPKRAQIRTYLLDNTVTNPSRIWEFAGKPDFPSRSLRRKMRVQESPQQKEYEISANVTEFLLNFSTSVPAVVLINICYDNGKRPGRVTNLRYLSITNNEALLLWDDSSVNSKCLKTYVIDFKQRESVTFQRIAMKNIFSTSYQLDGCDTKIRHICRKMNITGQYRVAAMDMWRRLGPFGYVSVL